MPLRTRVDDHSSQDDRARDRHLPERRDVDDWQGVHDDAEEQGPEQRTGNRADAARDRNAADDASRNHRQLIADRDVGIGDAVTRHPEVTAQSRDSAGNRVDTQLLPGEIDAAITRRHRIAADRIERSPRGTVVQEDPRGDRHKGGDPDQARKSEEFRLRNREKRGAHVLRRQPGAMRNNEYHATIDGERSQRDHDRRNAEPRDEHGVDQAQRGAECDRQHDDRLDRNSRRAVAHQGDHHAGQRQIGGDGKVDAPRQ